MDKYMFTYWVVEEVQSSEKLVVAGSLTAGILALPKYRLIHSTKKFSCIFAKFSPDFFSGLYYVEST
jgi:hypothetical protein